MKGHLLDINALVALFWPAHAQHGKAVRWFGRQRERGWATCPFTEAGFVRIISNPAFSRDALRPTEAVRLLKANTEAADHRFWSADLTVTDALARFRDGLRGHQQVMDAYLLALAAERGGVLATFDAGVGGLCEKAPEYRGAVVMIE